MILPTLTAFGQPPREDVIWGRRTTETITLDGVLNEPGWAAAESFTIKFGVDNGVPGSGWKIEGGTLPNDSTLAVLKFLVKDNQLYLGATVPDKSIGGSADFNRFDGFLMGLKDRANGLAPKPVSEYFYAWWYAEEVNPLPVGLGPAFIGRWAEWPPGSPRTLDQIAAWDAVTVVNGLANSDTTDDVGYTVEMRFDLTVMGYESAHPAGEIIEWNISIYDCDWLWPLDVFQLAYNRVWWQSPWGNVGWYNEVKIMTRPDVTVSSGAVPVVGPEYFVFDGNSYAAPTIDGVPNETVWGDATGFDIRYGDDALRQSYSGVGPYRAGQFQPTVNGGVAAVLDPGDATVKMFFKDQFLYLGFDVRDQVVQHATSFDRWDGFLVTLNHLNQRGPDNELLGRRVSFQVGPTGLAVPQDYLTTLVNEGSAEVAISLNAGTTVDTLGLSADNGYTAELKIDMTRFGYSTDLSEGQLFIGVTLLDGDSFTPYTDSYGTRTWWYREYEGDCCPAWAYFGPQDVTGVGDGIDVTRSAYQLLGAFPNPASRSTIRYSLPEPAHVTLELFDVQGRLLKVSDLGDQPAGVREFPHDAAGLASGIYLYRLKVQDPVSGSLEAVMNGRITVLD